MNKINQAIEKITKECEQKPHLIPYEEYLTSICTNDQVADKILGNTKLEDCYKAMEDKARQRQVNGVGFLGPDEGFTFIEDFYGITPEDKLRVKAEVVDIMDFV